MPKKIKKATLGGRRWTLNWKDKVSDPDRPKEKFVGMCWHDKRTIDVCVDQPPKEVSETTIHEGIHALFPFLTEEVVDQAARELNELLWAAGFIVEK